MHRAKEEAAQLAFKLLQETPNPDLARVRAIIREIEPILARAWHEQQADGGILNPDLRGWDDSASIEPNDFEGVREIDFGDH